VSDEGVCSHLRLAAGSVAPVPIRLRLTEALLTGERLGPEVLAAAAGAAQREVAPISDVRASADYRRHIVGVYVRRALEGLL